MASRSKFGNLGRRNASHLGTIKDGGAEFLAPTIACEAVRILAHFASIPVRRISQPGARIGVLQRSRRRLRHGLRLVFEARSRLPMGGARIGLRNLDDSVRDAHKPCKPTTKSKADYIATTGRPSDGLLERCGREHTQSGLCKLRTLCARPDFWLRPAVVRE